MRKLIGNSFAYLFVTIVGRLIGIFILPLYSHYLTPEQYGLFGLSNAVGQVLTIIMSLGLSSTISRFYFDATNDVDRKSIMGIIVSILVVFPLALLLLLEWQGETIFRFITPGVPYNPYLRIVVWNIFFVNFSMVPVMVLRCQERVKFYTTVVLGQVFIYHSLAIIMVIYFRMGVLGLLFGNMLSSLVLVPIYILQTRNMVSFRFSRARFNAIIKYTLPLIPHGFSGWILSVSDRIILQRSVSLADIGIYSLGYSLGSSVQNVSDAVNAAWSPSFYRAQSQNEIYKERTARIVTFLVAAICGVALLAAIGGHYYVNWLLPTAYAGTEHVIIWVAAACIFIFVYYILSLSIHFSKKTWYLSMITGTAGAINVVSNIFFVPIYGYIFAAISTFVAYFIMASLSIIAARKLYPVAYEYRKWFVIIGTTLLLMAVAYFRISLSIFLDILFSAGLCVAWVAALIAYGLVPHAIWQFWSARFMQLARERLGAISR